MKGLKATCFVILCLSLGRGAPTNEESELITKTFNFGKRDIIYSANPFWKDKMVYALCDGRGRNKKCDVYVDTTKPEKNPLPPCSVNFPFDYRITLANGDYPKVFFVASDRDTNRTSLISVNLDGCESNEVSIDAAKGYVEFDPWYVKVYVVSHENNYDVFFHNIDRCGVFLCKATYDYKGNVVKAVSRFPLQGRDSQKLEIKYVNNAYLIRQWFSSTNLYLLSNNGTESRTLLQVRNAQQSIGISTEENKIGYCTSSDGELSCKQYDSEGKNLTMEVKIRLEENGIVFLDVLNLEKGLLMLSISYSQEVYLLKEIVLVHFDEHAKRKKFINLDLNCGWLKSVDPKLYKDSNGKYCVTSTCTPPLSGFLNLYTEFSRSTRCFHETELF